MKYKNDLQKCIKFTIESPFAFNKFVLPLYFV